MNVYRFLTAIVLVFALAGCQTNTSNHPTSGIARSDPAFADLFQRIDKLWAIDNAGTVFVKPDLTGSTFIANTRICQNKALDRAKLKVTVDDSENPITPELQEYLDAIAMEVWLEYAIEEEFPACMKDHNYLQVRLPKSYRDSLRSAKDDQIAGSIVDRLIASNAFEPIKIWGVIDSVNAIADYRRKMKSEPDLMYPIDAVNKLKWLEANFRFRSIVVREGVLSSADTAFLGLSPEGWTGSQNNASIECETGMFGVLSVAVNEGWVQGYIKFSEVEPVQVSGLIQPNGKGELASYWPMDNPIKIKIEIATNGKIGAEISGDNGQSCGQRLTLSNVARSLFDDRTLADWIGGRLRTKEKVIQDSRKLKIN